MTVFVDVPADRVGATAAFWAAVTGSTVSEPRGSDGQFVTLLPTDGDPSLRVQRLDGEPRLHLDLHVGDVDATRRRALGLGATDVADLGYRIMRSPGGFPFCLVRGTESQVAPPLTDPVPHRVDQLCLDVPAGLFDDECAFWSALLDIAPRTGTDHPEFVGLPSSADLPFGLLLQRLGDDSRTVVAAHLDLSCGGGRAAVAEHHVSAGAEFVAHADTWTVLRDPAGLAYCVTDSPVRR